MIDQLCKGKGLEELEINLVPSLNQAFGNQTKLDHGRGRFACRIRGTPGQNGEFELADDWLGVSSAAQFPPDKAWQVHRIEFEIRNDFKEGKRPIVTPLMGSCRNQLRGCQ